MSEEVRREKGEREKKFLNQELRSNDIPCIAGDIIGRRPSRDQSKAEAWI